MPYQKQIWIDGETPVDAAHMGHIEDGIAGVDAAIPPAARLVPTPIVNGQWLKGVGGAAVWSTIRSPDVNGAARVVGLITQTGGITYGRGFTVVHSGPGTYMVTLAAAIPQPVPLAAAYTQGAIPVVQVQTAVSIRFAFITPAAYMDSDFYFVVFDASDFPAVSADLPESPEIKPLPELPQLPEVAPHA